MGFVNKSFNNVITFTRNSSATYTDPMGEIRTAGVNEPRFTFDPETGESLGLLIEEQRTNLLIWSENSANRTFTPASQVSVSNGFPAPSGVYANYLVNTEFNGSFAIFQTLGTITAGTPVTLSVFVGNSTNIPNIVFNMGDDFRVNVRLSDNTLQALSAGLTTSNTTLRVKPCLNGRRISVTVTLTSNQTRFGVFFRKSSSSVSYNENWVIGDLVSITGFQLEQASTPSSYIPTEASAVTRLADNVSRTLGAEWNHNEGTLYLEFEARFISTTTRTVAAIEVTTNDRISLYTDSFGRIFSRIRTGGISYDTGILNYQIGNNKVCLTFKNGQIARMFLNGLESTGLTPVVMPNLSGQALNLSGVSVGNQWNMGGKKDFRYYPRALSQAEAQALTKI